MNLPPVGLGTMGIEDDTVVSDAVTVATKLWTDNLAADGVRPGTEASLDRLGLDRVDLLYVHRPRGGYDPETTLPALETVREAGLTDSVGVSNFDVEQLRTASEYIAIDAHQVEFHPFWWQRSLLNHAQRHDYPLVAYSPLAGGQVFEDPTIAAIGETHGTTPAAVAIAWATSYDTVVTIPKASSRAHLEGNLAAADLELDDEEIARIEAIEREEELFPE